MVTEDQTFYGAMDLKDLIIARQDSALEDLIVTSYPYVYGHELIDDCIEKLKTIPRTLSQSLIITTNC